MNYDALEEERRKLYKKLDYIKKNAHSKKMEKLANEKEIIKELKQKLANRLMAAALEEPINSAKMQQLLAPLDGKMLLENQAEEKFLDDKKIKL